MKTATPAREIMVSKVFTPLRKFLPESFPGKGRTFLDEWQWKG
jgi:hypothetical protein